MEWFSQKTSIAGIQISRFQLIDDSTVRQLGLAYAQAQAGGRDPRADRPKPFTAQRSCRRR
jgi:hypothetical protein